MARIGTCAGCGAAQVLNQTDHCRTCRADGLPEPLPRFSICPRCNNPDMVLPADRLALGACRDCVPDERPRVYVASPYSAPDADTLDANIQYAADCTRDSALRGEAPYTPHLYLTTALNDDDPAEREAGMAVGAEYLRRSDLLAVYIDRGISRGMLAEVNTALDADVVIELRRLE